MPAGGCTAQRVRRSAAALWRRARLLCCLQRTVLRRECAPHARSLCKPLWPCPAAACLQDAVLRREGSLQAYAEVLISDFHRVGDSRWGDASTRVCQHTQRLHSVS